MHHAQLLPSDVPSLTAARLIVAARLTIAAGMIPADTCVETDQKRNQSKGTAWPLRL